MCGLLCDLRESLLFAVIVRRTNVPYVERTDRKPEETIIHFINKVSFLEFLGFPIFRLCIAE